MTPAARLQAAIEILDRVLDGEPAEKALTTWARRSRFAGSKDRAAVRDHVFTALRCRRSHAALGGSETGRGLILGALREGGDDPDSFFTGEGHAPAPLSDAERTAGRPPPPCAIARRFICAPTAARPRSKPRKPPCCGKGSSLRRIRPPRWRWK